VVDHSFSVNDNGILAKVDLDPIRRATLLLWATTFANLPASTRQAIGFVIVRSIDVVP
jgi:hypothetical protein